MKLDCKFPKFSPAALFINFDPKITLFIKSPGGPPHPRGGLLGALQWT